MRSTTLAPGTPPPKQGKFLAAHQLKLRGANASIYYELDRAEHGGLHWALDQIKEIKEYGNHITSKLSHADLIQLGAICAVQYCEGPQILFKMGRQDATEAGPVDRLPDPSKPEMMTQVFHRMGFNDQQIVAIMGRHTLGGAKMETSGYQGRWTQNPYVFDNAYYKEILLGDKSKFLKTESDIELGVNPRFRPTVEAYAQDQALFFKDYAEAHVMLGQAGQEHNLLCEIEDVIEQEKLIDSETGTKL